MTVAGTEDFYGKIVPFKDARGVSDSSNFHDVPADWHVLLADVQGSTQAIREGRYKDVNLVGASAIAAVLNLCRPLAIPYVFGGDGATFVVPSRLIDDSIAVLNSVAAMSLEKFGLKLRVGSISVEELKRRGGGLNIAKQALSEPVQQAVFSGGGLSLAEDLIKKSSVEQRRTVPVKQASYEGLECRWRPLEAQRGEIVSVLVRAESDDVAENFRIYQDLIREVEGVFGVGQLANPVQRDKLKLTWSLLALRKEQKIRSSSAGAGKAFAHFVEIFLRTMIGRFFFAFKTRTGGTDWDRYKAEVAENSDFWKFDDMLRFVVDISAEQKKALVVVFESRFRNGRITYGMHSSSCALLTCLVFSRQGDHIHFVDGGDGGYAMAAVELKRRIKSLQDPVEQREF